MFEQPQINNPEFIRDIKFLEPKIKKVFEKVIFNICDKNNKNPFNTFFVSEKEFNVITDNFKNYNKNDVRDFLFNMKLELDTTDIKQFIFSNKELTLLLTKTNSYITEIIENDVNRDFVEYFFNIKDKLEFNNEELIVSFVNKLKVNFDNDVQYKTKTTQDNNIYFSNNTTFQKWLDELRKDKENDIINNIQLSDNSSKIQYLYKTINDYYWFMTFYVTDNWHLKKDIEGYPFQIRHKSKFAKNLILILSKQDYNKFNPTINHKYIYYLPKENIMYLDILSGTAYMLDKRALKMSAKFKKITVNRDPKTNKINIYIWYNFSLGLFHLYPGVKITKAN